MANDNKFVVKNGLATQNISFVDDTQSATNTITVTMLNNDTLSFSGDSGQLFSITDSMTGTIFAVNDISGVPSIEVDDDGTIRLAETFGNILVGTAVDNGNKFQVNGNSSFSGTLNANNVNISGNLTVSGTTTYINTTTLNIGDNIVTLNADLPAESAPTENAGIEIKRGSSANAALLWDEAVDRWTVGSSPFQSDGIFIGNTQVINSAGQWVGDPNTVRGYTGSQGFTGSQGPIGFTGSIGGIGFTGSRGFTGSQGPIGFTGSQGIQGIQGIQGFTGSQGIQGIQGFTGSQGVQGVIGFTGSQGPIGFTGSQGIQGWTGSRGDTGFTGSSGFTGSQGPIGFTGSQGIQGIQGFTGSQGPIGFTGSQGIQGVIGFTGSSGFTGSQGIQGIQGFTGSQGIQGIQGFTGSQGIQGIQGFTGSQGIQGIQGFTGSQGIQGIQGFTGSQGPIGFTGSQGIQGVIGFTGSSGFTGSKGDTGAQGTTGFTGSRGVTGYNGSQGLIGYTGSTGDLALKKWIYKNSNYNALNYDCIIADTSSGAFSITLPSSPSVGTYIQITDGNSFATNAVTILRNGMTIEGFSDDVLLTIPGCTYELVYSGSTWQVTANVGAKGDSGYTGSAGPTKIIRNIQTAAYTLQALDSARFISINNNVTVPSGVFTAGDTITVYNNSIGSISIIQGSGVTMYLVGTSITGNRILNQKGLATIMCVDSNTFVIIGGGIS